MSQTAEPAAPRRTPGVARWLPSSQVLGLWALWWLWRYAAVAALPGYGELAWPSAAGFLVDALLLDALAALLRWRAGDAAYRQTGETDPLGPRWLRELVGVALVLAALARAIDGLHCHLAHRHVDADFWGALAESGGLWGLRYVLVAALLTGLAGRWLLLRELAWAARMRQGLGGPERRRLVHVEAVRAALGACAGSWIGVVAAGEARALVAPGEWWTLSSLIGG